MTSTHHLHHWSSPHVVWSPQLACMTSKVPCRTLVTIHPPRGCPKWRIERAQSHSTLCFNCNDLFSSSLAFVSVKKDIIAGPGCGNSGGKKKSLGNSNKECCLLSKIWEEGKWSILWIEIIPLMNLAHYFKSEKNPTPHNPCFIFI